MRNSYPVKIIGILLIGYTILALAVPVFPMYVGNYSQNGFDESDSGGQSTPANTSGSRTNYLSIKDLIIKSATYFLNGKSSVDILSAKLEISVHEGIDLCELQMIVNDALNYMRAARYYYQLLMDKANNTPYNQAVIDQLIAFAFNTYAKDNNLNSDIFEQVKDYLQTGNIRGAYVRFYIYADTIIDILENVQMEVYSWKLPDKGNIWKLNQECAHMLLFGQYIAQIFYNL